LPEQGLPFFDNGESTFSSVKINACLQITAHQESWEESMFVLLNDWGKSYEDEILEVLG